MTRVTFYGLPAWIGAIHGPTVCEWWDRDPAELGWDRSRLRKVDLARTSAAALAGRIPVSEVEIDHHMSEGGRTTIGPLWPGGAEIGACWVSERYLQRAELPVRSHEFQLIQYFDGEQKNRRFYGFHASVLAVQGRLSLVQVWHPGTGTEGAPPAGSWWIDLGAHADPSAPRLLPNRPGPLYLDTGAVRELPTFDPKIPPFRGGFGLPAQIVA